MFVTVNGTVFFSIHVRKVRLDDKVSSDAASSLEKAPQGSRRSWKRMCCWTDTGYLKGNTIRHVIDDLGREWGIQNPGREALLFGSQLGCHNEVVAIQAALDQTVYVFFLAPSFSHTYQPLDEVPCASFKKAGVGRGEQATMDALLMNCSARDALLHSVP